jgi:hypothetical protein
MAWNKLPIQSNTTIINGGNSTLRNIKTKAPTVAFVFDDTCAFYSDNVNIFTSRNVAFTTAFRQDFISNTGSGTTSITWEQVKSLQDAGMEIAFHGMHHNYTGVQQYIDENDVPTYLSNCESHGININGWVGPNGDFFEDFVFHTNFNNFKWGRGGGNNGVANVASAVDYFKYVPTNFIDDLTSDAALTTLKSKIDTLVTKGTGVLILSMHWSSTQLPYMAPLLDYILSQGIQIKTVSQAYETYGAILEYFDKTMTLNTDLTKRQNGNTVAAANLSLPHFILQNDGNIISNMPIKLVQPKKGNATYTGNSLPNDFDFGISVIQYGTSDTFSGFPAVGELYNFNFGRNDGNQFQLYKAYNKGGIYFREANTNNTWKSSFDKLGIFRTTPPTTPTSTGAKGDWSADSSYLYICYADNAWIRVAKDSTWA